MNSHSGCKLHGWVENGGRDLRAVVRFDGGPNAFGPHHGHDVASLSPGPPNMSLGTVSVRGRLSSVSERLYLAPLVGSGRQRGSGTGSGGDLRPCSPVRTVDTLRSGLHPAVRAHTRLMAYGLKASRSAELGRSGGPSSGALPPAESNRAAAGRRVWQNGSPRDQQRKVGNLREREDDLGVSVDERYH